MSSENCIFFKPVQVLNRRFVTTAKWHIISLVYRHCIKSIIHYNITCFYLQTLEMYVKQA